MKPATLSKKPLAAAKALRNTAIVPRYFLTEFLRPLAFGYLALIVLILVSELLEHLDKFIAGKAGFGVVAEYLLSLVPMRTVEIFPVAVLLAALFSLGNLSRRQEITAAMAGGLHPWRCVQLVVFCGFIVSVGCFLLNEYVVPPANRHARTLWKLDIRHYASLRQTRFDRLTGTGREGVFYLIGLLDSETGRMEDVVLETTGDGVPARQWQAREALWRDGRWVLTDGVERRFASGGTELVEQRLFSEEILPLKEGPEELIPKEPEADEMNYRQFNRHLRRLRDLGIPTRRQEVELHMKLAFPWTSFIVLLLGIPFAFRKAGGKVKAIGIALGVAFLYIGLMQVGRALGQKPWCPPLLGAWLANIVFFSVGAWLFVKMKKLS
jgi:lipopolysaccharide export system permease protein